MFGCIQWASHQRVKAISSWREAILTFRARQASLQLDAKRVVWYNLMLPRFEKYLETAIENNDLPEYEDATGVSVAESSSTPPASSMDLLKWMSIPVSDSVPAGGFGAVGYDPDKEPLVVMEVFIKDEPYNVYSIHRNAQQLNTIVIDPAGHYHTVRVNGKSMNNASPVPIENDDYILVRVQNNAKDNDIVVATLNGPSPLATVKRLGFTGGRITLRPESNEPAIQNDPDYDRAYSIHEIRINGVVEAVFKKK
jgi:SOS-response transcriptional repressor LexA